MRYTNAGWEVTIDDETGRKTRTLTDPSRPVPEFPESMDLKVTNFCNAGCAWCHENSTMDGKHARLSDIQDALGFLPPGVELAVGGGDPTAWPEMDPFLEWAKCRGLFVNLTVNGLHFNKNFERLVRWQRDGLVHGVGVSAVTTGLIHSSFRIPRSALSTIRNLVGHIILGRFEPPRGGFRNSQFDISGIDDDLADSFSDCVEGLLPAYLVLGYKRFGRGVQTPKSLGYKEWRVEKPYGNQTRLASLQELLQNDVRILVREMARHGIPVSFDNLALEQARVDRLVPPEVFKQMYGGPDGMFTMYADAVEKKWGRTSTQPYDERVGWNVSLQDFFRNLTSQFAERPNAQTV